MAEDTEKGAKPVAPSLRDRRSQPPGVVPRQSQAYVITGVALMILFAVMFSKRHAKPAPSPVLSSTAAGSAEANARQIADLKAELDQEQRKSEHSGARPAGQSTAGMQPAHSQANAPAQPGSGSGAQSSRQQIEDAERALSFKARFASNLVTVADGEQKRDSEQKPAIRAVASQPSQSPSAAPRSEDRKRPAEVNVNAAAGQPYVLFEGTTIDTALVNRLTGDFSGPVKVMVTNPVYSHDRQHVLIPEGSFLLGQANHVGSFGQRRLAVTFDRMLMPDGYAVDLDRFQGVSQTGETGLADRVNNHYLQIFGASIALGVISGAAESTTNSGFAESGSDAYRQGIAASLAQSGATVLDRFLNVLPTITIREGQRIKVYLTQDLLLPAWENHAVSPNI
jgi:type IV secretory pathway VirB10-like protein